LKNDKKQSIAPLRKGNLSVEARVQAQSEKNDISTLDVEGSGRKRLWIWRVIIFILPVLVIFAAIGGTLMMGGLKPEPEDKEEVVKAIPVLTARAIRENVNLEVRSQGDVQPRTEIGIVPQIAGRITYMSPQFIEGGRFNKGDLLVRIEPREYELRVTQARAEIAQAQTVITREESEASLALRDWQELGRTDAPTDLTLRKPAEQD